MRSTLITTAVRKTADLSFKAFAIFGMLVVLALGFVTLQSSPSISDSSSDQETYRQLSLFGDAFQLNRNEYVEQIHDRVLIRSAIDGMLSDLDP
ncbi:MAG: hypothetical protein J4F41_01325, partial [Alphaproteobacteria bacterium]|nr:hypothetical protein [Alphaproteobacteria bacterium]